MKFFVLHTGKLYCINNYPGSKKNLCPEEYFLIIADLGEAESESIPLKIRYDQIFF